MFGKPARGKFWAIQNGNPALGGIIRVRIYPKKDTVPMSADASQTRLDNIRRALAALDPAPDALLLTDLINLAYVSGFTGSTAQALITPDEALFITDSRYILRAAAECRAFHLVETQQGSGGYGEALQTVLAARPHLRRLGFEAGHVTVAQRETFGTLAESVEWVGTKDLVEDGRQIKDAGEVEKIRRAIIVAETALESVKHLLVPGTREQDFALELEYAMRRGGAEAAAFDTIVASGALGAHPHHHAGPRPFVAGDFVTIDWGARVDRYNSDITRTFAIGHASDKQREVYAVVLEAQQRAIAAIRPGKNGKEIDAVARDFIAERGYGDAFGHGLGHSLGLSVHDGPGFSVRTDKLILQPGMVLTVEPGIYLENWGGVRVEEDILVTETGCEILTHLPNGLEVL
jgi:Xaa-Pro aminopeptidase